MTLTFSLLFIVFIVAVTVKLWRVLDKVENHLNKLDSFLEQRGLAPPASGPKLRKQFAARAGS